VQIKGDLYCSGAKLRVKEGDALFAVGVEIGGSVFLNVFQDRDSGRREDFESTGTIRLLGAQIKGILSCSGAKLKVTARDAVFADCAVIGANVSFDKGFESNGAVRLLGARIGGELAFIGAKTTLVICKDLRLGGDMFWMGIQEPGEAILHLTGASVKNLRDERESWPPPGHLILDGLAYEELTLHKRQSAEEVMSHAYGPELPFNVDKRIEWLMLQGTHRADAGLGRKSAAQAAAYSSSDLDAPVPGARGSPRRRSHGAALCAGAEARTGAQRAGSLRATEL
jgi:hypothetical protein